MRMNCRMIRQLVGVTTKRYLTAIFGVLSVGTSIQACAQDVIPPKYQAEPKVAVRSLEASPSAASTKIAENLSEGIDLSQIDTPVWRQAIEQLTKRPGVQAGHAQLSVLRIILKDDPVPAGQAAPRDRAQRVVSGVRLFIVGEAAVPSPAMTPVIPQKDRLIHVSSTKLTSMDPQDGGGQYKELKSGDFVVVEHINSTRRNNGRDPLQVGSWTHRHAELWVPVPPRGELGVLGDLVLERVSPEEMGGVIVELDTSAVPGASFKSMHFGPLFTGGMYGRTFQATDSGIAGTNRVAPGTYSLALPGIREERGHWPVTVKPGETTYLRFRWNAERVLELVEQQSLTPRTKVE